MMNSQMQAIIDALMNPGQSYWNGNGHGQPVWAPGAPRQPQTPQAQQTQQQEQPSLWGRGQWANQPVDPIPQALWDRHVNHEMAINPSTPLRKDDRPNWQMWETLNRQRGEVGQD